MSFISAIAKRLGLPSSFKKSAGREKIPAIVLSYDSQIPFVELIIKKYKDYGWDRFLQFRVPLNEKYGSGYNVQIENDPAVTIVQCGKSIADTISALIAGLEDEDWVFWCISDRYPIFRDSKPTYGEPHRHHRKNEGRCR